MSVLLRIIILSFMFLLSITLPADLSINEHNSSSFSSFINEKVAFAKIPAVVESHTLQTLCSRSNLRFRPVKFSLMTFSLSDLQEILKVFNFKKLVVSYSLLFVPNLEYKTRPNIPRAPPYFI